MFFKKKSHTPSHIDYVVMGLGNPGTKYEFTRHNVGFLAVDYMAKQLGIELKKKKFNALYATGEIDGKKVLFAKPQTYMNNSGVTALEILNFYKIDLNRLIVIFDEAALQTGALRIKRKGSDGGHNGIKSIINLNGGDGFPRIKIGIDGPPNPGYPMPKWVLSNLREEDLPKIKTAIQDSFAAVKLIVSEDIDAAMNRFN